MDEEEIYDEIDEVIKGQLNRPRTKHLVTELPSLKDQKDEVINRRNMREKFRKIIRETDYIAPPLSDDFTDYAMKNYIIEEYPAENENEINKIIKKYVGKERFEIPNQFDYVINGGETRMIREMKKVENSFTDNLRNHILEHAKKAIPVLQNFESNRETELILSDPVFLELQYDLFTCSLFDDRIPVKMKEPFTPISEADVCFVCENKKGFEIVREGMDDQRFSYRMIECQELEEFDHDRVKLELFVRSYDYILVEESVRFNIVDREITSVLEKENKIVYDELENLVGVARKNLEGSIFSIERAELKGKMKVGIIDMKESELFENLQCCLDFLVKYFSEEKIKMLYLKTNESPKLYIFKNYREKNQSKKFKKRKRDPNNQLVEEENNRISKKRKLD